MSVGSEDRIYVSMMVDSLRRKKRILEILYSQTKEQEELLSGTDVDTDRFEELLNEKGEGIDELNRLDDGFDSLFKKLETELKSNKASYGEEIETMKELIRDVTSLGTNIQVLEKRNQEKFKSYIAEERRKIRESNKSQQTATMYAQSMSGYHRPGSSYFVNETK